MPLLGDYIGQLMAEITIARMHADLETLRVAELYASHPLLRNMPVPHFRLPDIELSVPVVIEKMEEPAADASPRGQVDLPNLRKSFDTALKGHMEKAGASLTPALRRKLKTELDARLADLSQPRETSVDVKRIADDFSSTATRVLRESGRPGAPVLAPEKMKKMERDLKLSARTEFLKLRTPPPRLHALVTTKEIREAGPNEVVTQFRLKIGEGGVEWTQIESDGETEDRLIPE